MSHEFAEPIEAMDPRRIIAGAVTQDRIGRDMITQPDHDLAEIDVAGLRRGCAGPGAIIGVRYVCALTPRRVRRDGQSLQRRDKTVGRSMDGEKRPVTPAGFLRAGMEVY